MSSHLLPAIRSHVGDWHFYTTTLSFKQIASLIKDPDEIHERKKLSNWIQREINADHALEISNYIQENQQRFLGSLIIGVYDGSPDWASINIDAPIDDFNITEEQFNEIEGKLGFLHLTGNEKLFAIDGQHRVSGIKHVLQSDNINEDLNNESVTAIFVGHDTSSDQGILRTRRLFTTLNKKARPVSKAATIALDEDNGFAVVTRKIIDKFWLFEDNRNHITYTSTGSIPANSETLITSVVGLYEITKDLHQSSGKKKFESVRPNDAEIEQFIQECINFFEALLDKVDGFKKVFVDHSRTANEYRSEENNHLLFRPVGQRAFARAAQILISRGRTLEESIDALLQINLELDSQEWHHILWNPINNNMITNQLVAAETRLLTLAGEDAKNNTNEQNLQKLLDATGR